MQPNKVNSPATKSTSRLRSAACGPQPKQLRGFAQPPAARNQNNQINPQPATRNQINQNNQINPQPATKSPHNPNI
jgi:hypothetical protein